MYDFYFSHHQHKQSSSINSEPKSMKLSVEEALTKIHTMPSMGLSAVSPTLRDRVGYPLISMVPDQFL